MFRVLLRARARRLLIQQKIQKNTRRSENTGLRSAAKKNHKTLTTETEPGANMKKQMYHKTANKAGLNMRPLRIYFEIQSSRTQQVSPLIKKGQNSDS